MKKILVALAALALVASGAWAQSNTYNTQGAGPYFNVRSGQRVNATGSVMNDDASRDRDYTLAPTQIFNGTIAAGAADTTSIVDLSSYRTVALLFQISGHATNTWTTFAVNARYNLNGQSDSLSLFTIPCVASDSSYAGAQSQGGISPRGTLPAVGNFGDGEFPVTITNTVNTGGAATQSLPQGRLVWLTVPNGPGFTWPSQCSFRIRNILRPVALSGALTVRVWVMGTAK